MNEEKKEIAIVKEQSAMLAEVEPEQIVERAHKAAKTLMQVLAVKPKKVIINNEQYLEFEDWQMLAKFFNYSVGVESTAKLADADGYEATAIVIDARTGLKISSAISSCSRTEKKWTERDDFQIRSMAQTRACAKALRNVLAWVAVMAGVKPTPAEEMDGVAPEQEKKPAAQPKQEEKPWLTEAQKNAMLKSIAGGDADLVRQKMRNYRMKTVYRQEIESALTGTPEKVIQVEDEVSIEDIPDAFFKDEELAEKKNDWTEKMKTIKK